jgi:hypothetical protein
MEYSLAQCFTRTHTRSNIKHQTSFLPTSNLKNERRNEIKKRRLVGSNVLAVAVPGLTMFQIIAFTRTRLRMLHKGFFLPSGHFGAPHRSRFDNASNHAFTRTRLRMLHKGFFLPSGHFGAPHRSRFDNASNHAFTRTRLRKLHKGFFLPSGHLFGAPHRSRFDNASNHCLHKNPAESLFYFFLNRTRTYMY